MRLKFLSFSNLTLLVALSLSTVAAYYSIIGLTAIFAGAVIPVIIMGSILEVGKITTTVWLRKYWNRAGFILKLYLVPAVVALALLTSMGIFGFLSKAHMEQGVTTGDAQAKLALYDEKIKTQRDNIDVARKALQQMDAQVDARLGRSDTEQGAERAVAIRRQQAGERSKLQKEIGEAQAIIAKLNEERAPVAAETRKVEAEVGPIKYIAALIYGDNADQNMLESAVRWVIILLVAVFDPLAIALVLAANASKEWDDEEEEKPNLEVNILSDEEKKALDEALFAPLEDEPKAEEIQEIVPHHPDTHPYLRQGFSYPEGWEHEPPIVAKPAEEHKPEENIEAAVPEENKPLEVPPEEPVAEKEITVNTTEIITEGVTKALPYEELDDGWVKYDRKTMRKDALRRLKPELFAVPDNANQIKTGFGVTFPDISNKGDVFVRVDVLPNRVFKFDGSRWIELNKETSSSYLDNKNYIQFLINKVYTGEYDLDTMTEDERAQIEEFLKNQNS